MSNLPLSDRFARFGRVFTLMAVTGGVWGGVSRVELSAAEAWEAIEEARTFRASFDEGVAADEARGDGALYTLADKEKPGEPGLPSGGETVRVSEGGVQGSGALKFTSRQGPWIFYKAAENVPYEAGSWSGTVSCWLKVNPENTALPGYSDPIQVTTKAWNDASFFVDFDKEGDPRDFRLGAFADLGVWNPENEEVPEEDRPLLVVENPPFGEDDWTHVVFTWEKFNTGEKNGVARLYLNGKAQGAIEGWEQTYSWKEGEESRLYLGLNYIGLLDEVTCYERALSGQEIALLHERESGGAPKPDDTESKN